MVNLVVWPLIELIEPDPCTEGDTGDALLVRSETGRPLVGSRQFTFKVEEDLFDWRVPDGWIDLVVAMAIVCPHHEFLVITRNWSRCLEYQHIVINETPEQTAGRIAVAVHRGGLPAPQGFVWPLPNLHFGKHLETLQ